MQMRIFAHNRSARSEAMQSEVNDFLSALPSGAVKHVNTAIGVARSGLTDAQHEHYVITIWYEA